MKRGKEIAEFAERTRPTHCPKQRYTTRKRALNAAAISTHRSGEKIDAYKCDLCRAWHIGHATPSWLR